MKNDIIFVLLCEIANQIHEGQTSGIVSAHDYSWTIQENDSKEAVSLVIERVPDQLRNNLDVM